MEPPWFRGLFCLGSTIRLARVGLIMGSIVFPAWRLRQFDFVIPAYDISELLAVFLATLGGEGDDAGHSTVWFIDRELFEMVYL
jgi:hypothetical protein